MRQMELLPDLPPLAQPAVYFMTDGVRIKIGYTERPPKRRGGELKTEVIYVQPGDELAERTAAGRATGSGQPSGSRRRQRCSCGWRFRWTGAPRAVRSPRWSGSRTTLIASAPPKARRGVILSM